MRSVFRQIRKSLVEKGGTKKYLIYAFGEIFLVVLGILIALQINNWNEQQKNNKEEYSTLINLKAELDKNLDQLNTKILGSDQLIEFDSILLLEMNKIDFSIKPDSLDMMLHRISSPITFDPSDGVIKDIINSGKINLISNEKLRLSITSWESNLNEAKEIEQFLKELNFKDIRPYLIDKASSRNAYSDILGKSKFLWENMLIFKDKIFENLLVRSTEFNIILKQRYLFLKSEIDEMQQIIKYETTG